MPRMPRLVRRGSARVGTHLHGSLGGDEKPLCNPIPRRRPPMIRVALLLIGLVLLTPVAARAQGMTSEQADAILQELRAIRQLLQRGAGAAPARAERITIANEAAWALGRPDAPVTLVEFTDLECPFCRRFHVSTFEELRKQYIDTGKVRFITRDLPLTAIHPNALRAAHAARCAGEQGKFWELRHSMFVNGQGLAPESVRTQARDLGLDVAALESC